MTGAAFIRAKRIRCASEIEELVMALRARTIFEACFLGKAKRKSYCKKKQNSKEFESALAVTKMR